MLILKLCEVLGLTMTRRWFLKLYPVPIIGIQINDFPAAALNICLFTIHHTFHWQKLLKRYRQAGTSSIKSL